MRHQTCAPSASSTQLLPQNKRLPYIYNHEFTYFGIILVKLYYTVLHKVYGWLVVCIIESACGTMSSTHMHAVDLVHLHMHTFTSCAIHLLIHGSYYKMLFSHIYAMNIRCNHIHKHKTCNTTIICNVMHNI